MEYGERLLQFRAKHELTQRQLAQVLKVGHNMVFRYEKGITNPSARNKIIYEKRLREWEENKNENVQM